MATTNCLRVARFIPMANPLDGDVVQIVDASIFSTRFFPLPGGGPGNTLPIPTAEGDVMQADATLNWVAVPLDGGSA